MNAHEFARYPTGNFCNAHPSVRALPTHFRPLIAGRRVAGSARTARITAGQNGAIHRAIHNAEPGDLLVVDGAGSERYGAFGDLLAEACRMRQIAGAVLNCTIRDSRDIAALDFQVFSLGFHPEATAKTEPGEIDIPVIVDGIPVHPGDIVVGDDDGVVVIPLAIAAEVLVAVDAVARREVAIRERIQAGETTLEIFGLGGVANTEEQGKG
ncbi:MAG: RraA family protein [Pseudomonadota bacterium]